MTQPEESNLSERVAGADMGVERVTELEARNRELEAQNLHLRLLVAELLERNQRLRLAAESSGDDAARG
ncbi:hypothetical protein [Paracidobacterium acidisoli]|uniref:hypothetical protein n=1 Tax=Paracidobacterium acidisoli TaxID=2303751 RepID=UPI0011C1704A|nr:hypothetical protein [Paracidobacterium acidisoli]MBT9331820.1 hypothetical protein [Paracidobacterium acidisoli]